jgi:tetratricopeptide (TPR) repeat protein
MLWSTHALCEDVLSLKRAVQQLQTLASEVPSIARLRNLTEACYLCERGLSVDALTRYGAVFEMAWNEPGLRAAQELGAYARILRKAGQSARARDVCERALLAVNTNEQHFELLTFGLHSELALALAALGATARATELAENLLTTHLRHDNPLLRGLSHGVCAQVALCADDGTTFDSQIALMHQCFQRTQHPALFAQCQRLYERARRPRLPAANDQSQPALTLEDSLLETRLG